MTPFRPHNPVIDNRNHQQVRRIRRLHERGERERTGLHYIEGMRAVARAVDHGFPLEALVTCPPLLIHPFARHLVRQQRRAGTPILSVTPDVMASLALVDDPQGLGAVVRQHWTPLERILSVDAPCWVMLETLRSPGNLGAIVRTSEAVGGSGLILIGDTIDPYEPAAIRASMGSVFSQRFVRTALNELSGWRQRQRCALVGTSPAADADYVDLDFREPVVLVLGDERKGVSPELRSLCNSMVRIPMRSIADSLNVSVAAGVLLYEVFNQRRGRRAGLTAP